MCINRKSIPIDKIVPNPDQPRKIFDADALRELANSIKAEGLQTPIMVRPLRKRFEIVFGERRWRAHKLLASEGHSRFESIACDTRTMTTLERDIAAIVENLQRTDISPIEEARGFQRLVDGGLDPEAIAKRIGVVPFRVVWRLRLLNLAPDILALFESGNLDKQQAMELSRLDQSAQHRVLRMIRLGQLVGWKAVRNAVDGLLTGDTQADIFGGAAPAASREEIGQLAGMERRIASVAGMVASGWHDGECIIACRVNPDKAAHIADQLAAIQKSLRIMERELRNMLGQAAVAA